MAGNSTGNAVYHSRCHPSDKKILIIGFSEIFLPQLWYNFASVLVVPITTVP